MEENSRHKEVKNRVAIVFSKDEKIINFKKVF